MLVGVVLGFLGMEVVISGLDMGILIELVLDMFFVGVVMDDLVCDLEWWRLIM